MNYTEIGAYLKEERKRQGLSLEDVQEKTKISLNSLEAIEEGQVSELPHPVYVKGFIKNYAQLLGIDAREMIGGFTQSVELDEEWEDETETSYDQLAPNGQRKKWPMVSICVCVLLLGALGYLAFDLMWNSGSSQQFTQDPVVSSPVSKEPINSTQIALPDKQNNTSRQMANGSGGLAEKGQEEMPSTEATSTEMQAAQPGTRAEGGEASEGGQEQNTLQGQAEEPSSPTPANQNEDQVNEAPSESLQPVQADAENTALRDEHALQIDATEACWMSVHIDTKKRDLYLRPGESVTFRFDNSLEIKLGNAGGVSLTFNGQNYPLDADSGEVLSLTFP